MIRFTVIKGPIECWHVAAVKGGKPLSAIAIRDHNMEAAEMAFHLTQAAAWFQRVASGEATPEAEKPRVQATWMRDSRTSLREKAHEDTGFGIAK